MNYAISRILLMTAVALQPLVMALVWHHEAPASYDVMIAVVLIVWAIVVVVVIRRAVSARKKLTHREWVESLNWDHDQLGERLGSETPK